MIRTTRVCTVHREPGTRRTGFGDHHTENFSLLGLLESKYVTVAVNKSVFLERDICAKCGIRHSNRLCWIRLVANKTFYRNYAILMLHHENVDNSGWPIKEIRNLGPSPDNSSALPMIVDRQASLQFLVVADSCPSGRLTVRSAGFDVWQALGLSTVGRSRGNAPRGS